MAEESWHLQQHALCTSCHLNDLVTGLQSREQNKLTSVPNACDVTTEVPLPGPSVSVFMNSELGQSSEFCRSFPSSPPFLVGSRLCTVSLANESWSAISNGIDVKSACGQKKVLIFYHSVNQSRNVVSPFLSFPLQNQIAVQKTPLDACNMRDRSVENEEVSVMELINLEKVDENSVIDVESEMHEDTEEINALLYSDDSDEDDDCTDGDDDDDDDDDDEVSSTGHSPVEIKGIYGKFEKVSEDADEVASSDGLTKRQKLLDGGYKKSALLLDTVNSMKLWRSSNYCGVLESSSAVHKSSGKDIDFFLSEPGKKLKIREMLKIIEKMVPGLEGRASLQILDGAIDYLKSLRLQLQAEANWS